MPPHLSILALLIFKVHAQLIQTRGAAVAPARGDRNRIEHLMKVLTDSAVIIAWAH
jgi:hypothetical protein